MRLYHWTSETHCTIECKETPRHSTYHLRYVAPRHYFNFGLENGIMKYIEKYILSDSESSNMYILVGIDRLQLYKNWWSLVANIGYGYKYWKMYALW